MKIWIKILVLGFFLMASSQTYAQKFGHINSAELLSLMPEMKAAEKELETFSIKLDEQYKLKVSTFETKYKALLADQQKGIISPVEEQTRGNDIQTMQNDIQQFEVTAQQEIARKRDELINPILNNAQDAITQVANENGYTYIFDTSTMGILHSPDGDDILSLVKTRLGI